MVSSATTKAPSGQYDVIIVGPNVFARQVEESFAHKRLDLGTKFAARILEISVPQKMDLGLPQEVWISKGRTLSGEPHQLDFIPNGHATPIGSRLLRTMGLYRRHLEQGKRPFYCAEKTIENGVRHTLSCDDLSQYKMECDVGGVPFRAPGRRKVTEEEHEIYHDRLSQKLLDEAGVVREQMTGDVTDIKAGRIDGTVKIDVKGENGVTETFFSSNVIVSDAKDCKKTKVSVPNLFYNVKDMANFFAGSCVDVRFSKFCWRENFSKQTGIIFGSGPTVLQTAKDVMRAQGRCVVSSPNAHTLVVPQDPPPVDDPQVSMVKTYIERALDIDHIIQSAGTVETMEIFAEQFAVCAMVAFEELHKKATNVETAKKTVRDGDRAFDCQRSARSELASMLGVQWRKLKDDIPEKLSGLPDEAKKIIDNYLWEHIDNHPVYKPYLEAPHAAVTDDDVHFVEKLDASGVLKQDDATAVFYNTKGRNVGKFSVVDHRGKEQLYDWIVYVGEQSPTQDLKNDPRPTVQMLAEADMLQLHPLGFGVKVDEFARAVPVEENISGKDPNIYIMSPDLAHPNIYNPPSKDWPASNVNVSQFHLASLPIARTIGVKGLMQGIDGIQPSTRNESYWYGEETVIDLNDRRPMSERKPGVTPANSLGSSWSDLPECVDVKAIPAKAIEEKIPVQSISDSPEPVQGTHLPVLDISPYSDKEVVRTPEEKPFELPSFQW